MSNYYDLQYCPKCIQMTNHIMQDHPDHHYTAFCQKCGDEHEPLKDLTPDNRKDKE